MQTMLIAVGSAALYLIAYHTYGRFLARKLFMLDDSIPTPAHALRDDVDFCPANKEVLFGHHFTSIAGTGPIVGPAIAVIWGWLPALLWVLFGSILMGAVHDFGALALSLRYQGRSIGEIARDVINPRVRLIFLFIIFFALMIVLAIFGFVIAVLFKIYPASVLPVWIQIPIAVWIGHLVYRKNWRALPLSLCGVAFLYIMVYAGNLLPLNVFNDAADQHTRLTIAFGAGDSALTLLSLPSFNWLNPVVFWTILLMIYAYIASVIPVWKLLQPRDYLNGHLLMVSLGLLALGLLVVRPEIVAPAFRPEVPGAPSIWPFLFITIACGAVSGFHCMVGSGTTSKQLNIQSDALTIGYGSMLLEGYLAVLVILACVAGVGLVALNDGAVGHAAWMERYATWKTADGLAAKVGAFVEGSAKVIAGMFGNSGNAVLPYFVTCMAVFVVCFAATTLDTATRLQRYVVSEIAAALNLKPLMGKHGATLFAVATALALALGAKGSAGRGTGGLTLWPLFGATNQLLACLALLVVTIWLKRIGKPVVFTLLPMLFMMVMTGWSMLLQLQEFYQKYQDGLPGNLHLLIIGAIILVLEAWMIVESLLIFFQAPQLLSAAAGEEVTHLDNATASEPRL